MREVQSPDGRVWRVRRCWLPRRPWLPADDAVDRGRPYFWGYGGDWWWLIDRVLMPAIALAGDLVWFTLSIPLGIAARLLLVRPWRVRAETIGRPRRAVEIEARGWRASANAMKTLEAQIRSGTSP